MHLYTVFSLQSFFSLLELQLLLYRGNIYFQIEDVGILLCVHLVEMGTKTILHLLKMLCNVSSVIYLV